MIIQVIKPSVEVIKELDGLSILKKIEQSGRVCYKSEEKITDVSHDRFIRNILARKHEAVLEHSSITIKFICDRGVTHEIVRHRIASFCQESTRYCNYGDKIQFIKPCFFGENDFKYHVWQNTVRSCAESYEKLLKEGATPQEARAVLPNSLKTEIFMTANLREWRHFFTLRCSIAAHPQMREVALMALKEMNQYIPIIFEDLAKEYGV
jgi:thymidylate synthase (FAD)